MTKNRHLRAQGKKNISNRTSREGTNKAYTYGYARFQNMVIRGNRIFLSKDAFDKKARIFVKQNIVFQKKVFTVFSSNPELTEP